MVLAEDGCRLWTAAAGQGAPLVLCHGGPGLWDMFGALATPLAEHLRVIRWDQRGCGRSQQRGPYSLARSVADLDAVRGGLGLDRVRALVYVSGTGLGWAWHEPFQRNGAERLAPHRQRISELRVADRTEAQDRELAILQWSAEFTDGHAMRHAEEMATPWFGINQQCFADIWPGLRQIWRESDLIAECQALNVPVLIIDGAADIRPRWAVDSLAQALPNVRRVILPGAGHVPWLEVPGEFTSVLLDFLGGVS